MSGITPQNHGFLDGLLVGFSGLLSSESGRWEMVRGGGLERAGNFHYIIRKPPGLEKRRGAASAVAGNFQSESFLAS